MQELTSFIQGMLQQMQDRFQSMSDQVCQLVEVWLYRKFIRTNIVVPVSQDSLVSSTRSLMEQ